MVGDEREEREELSLNIPNSRLVASEEKMVGREEDDCHQREADAPPADPMVGEHPGARASPIEAAHRPRDRRAALHARLTHRAPRSARWAVRTRGAAPSIAVFLEAVAAHVHAGEELVRTGRRTT